MSGSDYALLLLESAVEGGNVLTMDAVDMIWELNARVLALEVFMGIGRISMELRR